jgi:hypothetical protein
VPCKQVDIDMSQYPVIEIDTDTGVVDDSPGLSALLASLRRAVVCIEISSLSSSALGMLVTVAVSKAK